jgi:putative oxidoreductase
MNNTLIQTSAVSRKKVISLWILKIAFALAFLGAAGAKLAGNSTMVAEFDTVGLGQWLRYVTGLIEVAGAVLLLVPRSALYGALLLAMVCAGALVAQVTAIHQDWIHTVVMGGLLLFVAWTQRARDNEGGE